MSATGITNPCPHCRQPVARDAITCPVCGNAVGMPVAEVRRVRDVSREGLSADEKAVNWLIPIFTHPWAIASSYLGLLSCFPIIGLGFGVLAIATGVLALRSIKRKPRSGGTGKAIFGIVFGTVGILSWSSFLVAIAMGAMRGGR